MPLFSQSRFDEFDEIFILERPDFLPYHFWNGKSQEFANVTCDSLDLDEHSRLRCPSNGVQMDDQHFRK